MAIYNLISDADFIEAYGIELSYGENGKPNGKIRSLKPVSEPGFVEELLVRKSRILPLLLEAAGWKEVTLSLVAYGEIDENGNRDEGYSVLFASLDAAEARRVAMDDLAGVPPEERKGVAVYLDSYPLLLKAGDNRTADELVRDIYMSSGWPYSKEADSLTLVEEPAES